MENNNEQQIEAYLRGKMSAAERVLFEAALLADPRLQERTKELRQFSEGVRRAARADIRKRVEALRDSIQQEESGQKHHDTEAPRLLPEPKTALALGILVGLLLGLSLGWLLFKPSPENTAPRLPAPNSVDVSGGTVPSAEPRFKTLYQAEIPGPNPGQTTSLIVSHNPALDAQGQPLRQYAFFGQRGGLCVYVRESDTFWKDSLRLVQDGQHFFLKIGANKYLIQEDGLDHDLPEKPANR